MKDANLNRRDFLRLSGLASAGVLCWRPAVLPLRRAAKRRHQRPVMWQPPPTSQIQPRLANVA